VSSAVVRQGDLKWLGELYNVLIDAGIPCTVTSDAGCNKVCCGLTLVVIEEENQEEEGGRLDYRY